MIEPIKFEVLAGTDGKDFNTGDFLNAIDEVFSWFEACRDIGEKEAAEALRMYAGQLERRD